MRPSEPDFAVWEYITITKDSRTGLVIALGGTREAASILQRNGFLDAPGPQSEYHRLPHGLPVEEERHKDTAASHALLGAGYSVHLDPALNTSARPTANARPPGAISPSSPGGPWTRAAAGRPPQSGPRSPNPMRAC
ncbi:hypothetical protein [Streptomyces prunicolor]|uniref:hypothetical protein n=1 Tax=Streptomyces prunicolor TaxID=67348 RepID=UPI0033DE1013